MHYMMKIKLKSKTRKGEQRLKNANTENWIVVKTMDRVAFSGMQGPWFLVRPDIDDQVRSEVLSRWIHFRSDNDFEIEQEFEIL